MNPTADRGNRVLLTLLGLLLLAAGRLGLALSYAAFGAARARQPLLLPAARQFAHRNAGWFWPVVAVVAVVLGLLALRWLLRQVGIDRVRHLELEPNPSSGTTTASSSAISDAVTDEVESYHGADAASVRLIGGERDPDSSWSSPSPTALTPARSAAESKEQAVAYVRQAIAAHSLPRSAPGIPTWVPTAIQLRTTPVCGCRAGD